MVVSTKMIAVSGSNRPPLNGAKLLRKTDQRQRVADGLYRGIASYLESLNSLSYDKSKLVSDNHPDSGGGTATIASEGNPK